MKIIILRGDPRHGKSTTIGMVYAALLFNRGAELEHQPLQGGNSYDFEAVLGYQGKKVAFYSKGDNQTDCYDAITRHETTTMADILVLAHSTTLSPLTVTAQGLSEETILKTYATGNISEVQANATDCRKIISLIH